MYSTLEFDIRPGSGIGIFEIGTTHNLSHLQQPTNPTPTGSSLWTILDTLRRLQHHFPQIDVKYDPDTSATTPLVLQLRPHIDLLFSGTHQRLHTICIHKLQDTNPPLILKYKDTVLSSPEEVLRRVGVSRTFGPTYPTGSDDLRYPGLWFGFEEDVRPIGVAAVQDGGGLKGKQVEDRLQEVKKIIISQKGSDGKMQDALDEVAECSVMHGDIERAIIKVNTNLFLYF